MKLHIPDYKTIRSDYILYTSLEGNPSILVNKVKQCYVCGKVKSKLVDDAEFCNQAARDKYEINLKKSGYKQVNNLF